MALLPGQEHVVLGRPKCKGDGTFFASFVMDLKTMAKKRITKKELLKIEEAAVREERKQQGALDGRFREKKEESEKRYKRKPKHRGSEGA